MVQTYYERLPMALTDTDGIIIYCNDAARDMCAALAYGVSIFLIAPDLKEKLVTARAEGERSFDFGPSGYENLVLTVDLSKERSDGVIRIFPRSKNYGGQDAFSFESAGAEFLRASSLSGVDGARRVTALYEAMLSADTMFFLKKEPRRSRLRELFDRFFDSAMPTMRHIGHKLTLRCGSSVTDGALVSCDPYAFYLLLSALASAVGYAADGDIVIEAEHTGSSAVIDVSARSRRGIRISNAASFGVHAPDVIFAETVAHAIGGSISLSTDGGRVRFSVNIRAREYYNEYLKEDVGTRFILDSLAGIAASVICV